MKISMERKRKRVISTSEEDLAGTFNRNLFLV